MPRCTTVILDTIPGDPNNELAHRELKKLPGVTIQIFVLPVIFKGYVETPNISLPKEHEPPALRAYGLEGIQRFVQYELKCRSKVVPQ